MGLLTSVKNWGNKIFGPNNTASVVNYSYKTINYLFDQVNTIPRVVNSIVNHQPTRIIAGNLWHIATVDVIPLVFVIYANQVIQQQGRDYLSDSPDNDWMSVNTALQTSLSLVQAATWLISVRQIIKSRTHLAVVTIKAPDFNQIATSRTVCDEAPCTKKDFLGGVVRNLIVFVATEEAINLAGNLPFVGNPLAASLRVYHYGRYILTVKFATLCDDHQLIYSREHPELVLSLGLGAAFSAYFTYYLMEMSGIWFANLLGNNALVESAGGAWLIKALMDTPTPPILYATIAQLMLVMHMCVAAHMNLPEPKCTSTRTTIDPVRYFQDSASLLVDILALGTQVKIQRALKTQHQKRLENILLNFPWVKCKEQLANVVELMWHNRFMRIILPSMLHDLNNFTKDPIVSPYWPALRSTIVNSLSAIETSQYDTRVQMANYLPGTTSFAVKQFFGIPTSITKLLLLSIHDRVFIEHLVKWRRKIEALQQEAQAPIVVDGAALPLCGQEEYEPHSVAPIVVDGKALPLCGQEERESPSAALIVVNKAALPLNGQEEHASESAARIVVDRMALPLFGQEERGLKSEQTSNPEIKSRTQKQQLRTEGIYRDSLTHRHRLFPASPQKQNVDSIDNNDIADNWEDLGAKPIHDHHKKHVKKQVGLNLSS